LKVFDLFFMNGNIFRRHASRNYKLRFEPAIANRKRKVAIASCKRTSGSLDGMKATIANCNCKLKNQLQVQFCTMGSYCKLRLHGVLESPIKSRNTKLKSQVANRRAQLQAEIASRNRRPRQMGSYTMTSKHINKFFRGDRIRQVAAQILRINFGGKIIGN